MAARGWTWRVRVKKPPINNELIWTRRVNNIQAKRGHISEIINSAKGSFCEIIESKTRKARQVDAVEKIRKKKTVSNDLCSKFRDLEERALGGSYA